MKYEGIINVIARMILEGKTDTAKRHYKRAMKHYDDMTDAEKGVMASHRYELWGRPFENYSEKSDYWENKILAKQENEHL